MLKQSKTADVSRKKSRIIILILSLLIIIPVLVYTTPVNIETAKQVAMNWYSERNDKASNNFEIVENFIEKANSENIFYIFNFNKIGFVIVSADDAVVPILGYDFEQKYGLKNHPPQFDAMLASFKKQIVYAKKNNLSASKEITENWARLNAKSDNFVKLRITRLGPLLSTTWNQGRYYNEMCPYDASSSTGNDYVWAGCVATAMAQVMKYWNFPTTGTSSHSYTPYSHPEYGTQSANFGTTTYNWAGMPNNVTSLNTDVQTLLYHCGVSIEMDYGPNGSGAWVGGHTYCVRNALVNNFNYDSSEYFALKSSYTNSVWEGMIRSELDNSHPLVYRGYNSAGTSGHAFNLDGYEDADISHFHFNWGWSGSYNGYYYLNDLTPGSHDFTTDQGAIFGIKPTTIIPGAPSNPSPENLATNVSVDTTLSWTNGANTDSVDVYFSSTQSLVTSKDPTAIIYSGAAITSTDPSGVFSLDYDTTYYWRVVCKNSTKAETDGPVWSFTTESQGGVQVELIYHESSAYVCSLPDPNYNIPAYWQWFTPSGPGELLSLKFYLYPEYHDPHNGVLHLTVYDSLGGTSQGGIDIDTDILTNGWYEFDMSSVGYTFATDEDFYIQVTFTPDTGDDVLYMVMGDEENGVDIFYDGHSTFEYNGSYNYWWKGATDQWIDELNLTAVIEYETAPEIHDFGVQTLYFSNFFLPTETKANVDFQADVKNYGTFDETNVEIELVITDTTYAKGIVFTNSQYVSLVAGDSTTVTFDTWSVSTPGEYIVTVTSKLAGDSESSNDMIDLEQQVCSYPTELTYDDGTAESAWVKNEAGNGFANKFTPPYIPYKITDISYHIWADTWPDPGSNEMKAVILDDDGTDGNPGTTLYEAIKTVVRGAWNTFDVSDENIILDDGSFYVAFVTTANYPDCPGLSVDDSGPFAGQNVAWDLQDGVWTQGYASYGDEYMIRASVDNGIIPPPENVSISINGNDVELGWCPVQGANSYKVYSSITDPYNITTVADSGIIDTTWTDFGAASEDKKFYYVKSCTSTKAGINQYGRIAIKNTLPSMKADVNKRNANISRIPSVISPFGKKKIKAVNLERVK